MASTVRQRPNHYEVLGLSAAAGAEEIARAFANKMRVAAAGPIGAAAQLCAAYETLRDASKRSEYDRSIGIAPKPQPQGWSIAAPQPRWAPFASSATPRPAVAPTRPPRTEPPRSSIVAASLRELARPMEPEPAPQPPPRAEEREYTVEPDIRALLASAPASDEEDEERGFDWKRPALAVGGLVAAAGLIGIFAGVWARDGGDPATAEPALTVSVPAPAAHAQPAPALPAAEPQVTEARRPVHVARAIVGPKAPTAVSVGADEAEPQQSRFVESATDQAAADPLAPEPAEATETAASLPLPDKVVARTIERIGYPCGAVASTTAAAGGFKVTCTSGDSYRAAPVHGRYHFRRWNRN